MKQLRSMLWRPWRRWSKVGRQQRRAAKEHVQWLEGEARVQRDGKVTRGKDGWLFLADDSNDAFAQHTGARRLSGEDLVRWTELLERRRATLEELGCEYVLMVVPENHSVYPEKLPEGTSHAAERPVHQLANALRDARSSARVVYPLQEMVAQKASRAVCSRIDSHWTDYGAFIAYSRLLDELDGGLALRRLRSNEIAFNERITGGDLGNKLTPARLDTQAAGLIRYPEARPIYDNCIDNNGSVAITTCPAAPPTTCLLFGDSYAYPFLKFISETFGRVVFAHSVGVDHAVLREVRPDVVVSLMAERFLIEVPEDKDSWVAEQERWKRQNRRTRPPLTYWPGYQSLTPLGVEKLRAHLLATGRQADATMISMLAYGGLLPREMTQLTWSDVGKRELRIKHSKGGPSSRDRRARSIRMLEPLADDLRELRLARGDVSAGEPVFPSRRALGWATGDWAEWGREVFRPAVEACGLDIKRPHDLRRVFCTLRLHEGASVREVARQIGEKPSEVKKVYGYLLGSARTSDQIDAGSLVALSRRRWRKVSAIGSEPETDLEEETDIGQSEIPSVS